MTISPDLPSPNGSESGLAPEAATAARAKPETIREQGSPRELGGPAGPEPTRYGDWEVKGRCCDF